MNELEEAVLAWMKSSALQALEDRGRERVKEALQNWLVFTARKKPDVDLSQRLEDFRKRIGILADTLTLEVGQNGYVVRAVGDAETTLKALERGTEWFDPMVNLTENVVGAVFEQRS